MKIPESIISFYRQYFKECSGISTDTRTLQPQAIYVALKGDRFDGNDFIELAFQKGARAAIVSNVEWQDHPNCLFVPDTLLALQQLAHHHRMKFFFPVLGITGSNGKTTTKELVAHALQQQYRVHYTQGNLNNHIGVPLTLLQIKKDIDIAVIEMGANKVGDIMELCEIAAPTHGVITNIGKAHLKGFGSLEGVKKAKSELYDYLEMHDGVVFVDLDEKYLHELAKRTRQINYLSCDDPSPSRMETQIELQQLYPEIIASFNIEEERWQVRTNLFGAHNFSNVKTAITIAKYFKVSGPNIIKGLATYTPKNNRSQIDAWGKHTILKDAYNANPTSMRASINSFEIIASSLPKVLVLGDMLELGSDSESEHRQLVEEVVEGPWHKIFLVGPIFSSISFDASRVTAFADVATLKKQFDTLIQEPVFVLIKGSRGVALEALMD